MSLRHELAWLAGGGPLEVVVPAPGAVTDAYLDVADVTVLAYGALARPRTLPELAGAVRGFGRDVRGLRAHLRRARPARVIVVTTALPAALLAARLERVPTLLYVGESVPSGPGLATGLAARALLRLARFAAGAIVCCSDTVAGQFRGPGTPPVVTAYPPIADAYRAGDRDAARRRLGLPPDATCLVAAGAISPGRGQDLLVRALPALRDRFGDVRAVIAGEPHPRTLDRAYRGELDELVRDLGLEGSVVFAGFVDAMADLYAAADVVVNPAYREGFGRVAAEALVAGRPVVATAVDAVPEVLRAGVDAVLVPPGDVAALAAGIGQVLADPELARRLVSAGSQRVAREFSAQRSLDAFARAIAALG